MLCVQQLQGYTICLWSVHAYANIHGVYNVYIHCFCLPCTYSKTKAAAMSLATALSQDDGSQIRGVKGSWGTKVSALTGTLLSLPPGSKALVFSEWDQMLDIVQEVLLLYYCHCCRAIYSCCYAESYCYDCGSLLLL
jgi:hypothetical protein